MAAIEVQDLKKYYRETQVVDSISFSVESGEIFGLLGPNSAGKTTTIEIMEGMRELDPGEVLVLVLNVTQHQAEVKSRIGVQLQTTALFTRLTVTQDNNDSEEEAQHSSQNWQMVLEGLKKLLEGK